MPQRLLPSLAAHGGMPGSLLVTNVALANTVWTPRSGFQQDRHARSHAVRSLLPETALALEVREAVLAAVSQFDAGSCGFADGLVVAKRGRQGCDSTATFDRGMCKRVTLSSRGGLSHTASPQTCSLLQRYRHR